MAKRTIGRRLATMIAALMAATAAASARAASETVIYAFTGGSDGANPASALIYASGALFGTAENGGKGVGVVFSVTPAGIEKTVYAFTGGNDGATPLGALTVLDGIFYGTTFNGGSSFCGGGGCGTAFSLTPAGEEHVLYAFTTEGASEPQAGLTVLGEKLSGLRRLAVPCSPCRRQARSRRFTDSRTRVMATILPPA